MEELVASADVGGRYPVGNGEVVIRSRFGASPVVVPAYLASLLNQCSGFRTIDEHSRTLSGKTGVNPGDLSLSLQELRRPRSFGVGGTERRTPCATTRIATERGIQQSPKRVWTA